MKKIVMITMALASLAIISSPIIAKDALAASFRLDKAYYPSTANPNFLPNGTLIKATGKADIYYIKGGKKSWVLPSIASRWLTENHFIKQDIVITISATDFARYPQTSSINPLYIGKILLAPSGKQYYIDDKYRKREISSAVREALGISTGNLYPTSAAHLNEFITGPALTANKYAGGMAVYTGPYHGGQMWKIKEGAGGVLYKHLYATDYLYEADYNPDESFRLAAKPALFAKLARGANIEKYPDGYTVGLASKIYLVQGGKLRYISSSAIFGAMGYTTKNVLIKFPEFLQRYPQGQPVAAFKNLTGPISKNDGPKVAPNTANNLVKVRPEIRKLIADVNLIYTNVYDQEPTVSENKFWVDYIYNGETNNRADLIAIMKRALSTGKKPALTSHTKAISLDKLSSQWFSYLFYFVHMKEPGASDRNYWLSRINSNDLNTIQKLGGAIQWVKENLNATRR